MEIKGHGRQKGEKTTITQNRSLSGRKTRI